MRSPVESDDVLVHWLWVASNSAEDEGFSDKTFPEIQLQNLFGEDSWIDACDCC